MADSRINYNACHFCHFSSEAKATANGITIVHRERFWHILSKFYSVMGVALVPDHFQLISNILPRQLKLTNQKTPVMVMVDVETNEDIDIEENVSVPNDPEHLLNSLSSTFWILGKYGSRLRGK